MRGEHRGEGSGAMEGRSTGGTEGEVGARWCVEALRLIIQATALHDNRAALATDMYHMRRCEMCLPPDRQTDRKGMEWLFLS